MKLARTHTKNCQSLPVHFSRRINGEVVNERKTMCIHEWWDQLHHDARHNIPVVATAWVGFQ